MTELDKKINCIVCESNDHLSAHPYTLNYKENIFEYRKCSNCNVTFLSPTPSEEMFSEIYSSNNYHAHHYDEVDTTSYDDSASLLINHLRNDNPTILDYGCGFGHFITSLKNYPIETIGFEFDEKAASEASSRTGSEVLSSRTLNLNKERKFDAIHLGDVLEHLPNPTQTLCELRTMLNGGGIIFIEGPIEDNASLVYFFSKLYLLVKKILSPNLLRPGVPTHLIRLTSNTQKKMLLNNLIGSKLIYWEVYETGWPYLNNSFIKHVIGLLSIIISKIVPGNIFGNRFRAILSFEDK